MKIAARGDGWFDVQMSAKERDTLLHGLNFVVKNFDAIDCLEAPSLTSIQEGVRALREKSKPVEDRYLTRYDMSSFTGTSEALWILFIRANASAIDVVKLDPTLDLGKLRAIKNSINEITPNGEECVALYPKEQRRFMASLLSGRRKNDQNSH